LSLSAFDPWRTSVGIFRLQVRANLIWSLVALKPCP
jgi:hypothetical protein